MKEIFALLFLILGVVGGLYVGCYEFFIKGIALILETIQVSPINSPALAIGIFKVMFAAMFGWFTFAICYMIANIINES